jgi:hypothetical protein
MPICVISGTLLDGGSNPIAGAYVRIRSIAPTIAGGNAFAVNDLTTRTATDGTWSLTIEQGLAAQVDIEAAAISADIQVPTGSSTVAFSSLTLYTRGSLTPMTILSDHGPSLGGDLTGSSPNPSVVGLIGIPMISGIPTEGQGWAYSVSDASWTLQTLGGEVASITGGTGITIGGTASVPIVNISVGGVTNTQLAAGAATANIGSLSGALTGNLPTPALAASIVFDANVNAAAAIQWSKINKSGAVAADIGAASLSTVVNTVTEGSGIDITGTATNPIIGVAVGGVAATMLAASAAASNVGTLYGVLAGTLPAPSFAAGAILNADVNSGAAIAWTKISKVGAVPADIGAEDLAHKGATSGYAPLDSSGYVPLANLPPGIPTGLHASTHAYPGGSDPVSPASLGASAVGHTHAEADVTGLAADLADRLSKASGGTVAGLVTLSAGLAVASGATIAGGFVSAGEERITESATATSGQPTQPSFDLVVAGSVWTGSVAERRLAVLRNVPTAANAGKLSVVGYGGDDLKGSEVAYVNLVTGAWTGPVVGDVTGDLTGNADTATAAANGVASAVGTAPLVLNLAAQALTGSVSDADGSNKGVVKLAGDLGGTAASPSVAAVGGSSAANVHAAELLANAATDANTASAIVRRDAGGNFSAGTVTATAFIGALTGNATNVTGTVAVAHGGTGAVTLTGLLRGNGTSAITDGAQVDLATEATGILGITHGGHGQATAQAGFDALSPMSALGDLIYGGAAGTRTRLAGQTTTTRKFLRQTGDGGGGSAAPAWDTLAAGDIPNLAAAIITSGIFPVAVGGLGMASPTGLLRGNGVSPVTDGALVNLVSEVTGTLQVANGGSGAATFSTGYLKASGTSAFTTQAVPIPVADGGTGTAATFTAGALVYAGTSGIFSQDPTRLFYDAVTHRLGILTAVPGSPLTVAGDVEIQAGSGGVIRFADGTTQGTAPTGGGSIVSAGLTMPAHFSVSGSPLTGAGGTIGVTWASQTANYFLAAPNGSAGAPVFRAVVAADLPAFGDGTAGIVGPGSSDTTKFVRADGVLAVPPGTGSVTGSGTAGYVSFWTGASALSGDAAFFWDNTDKRLGVGNVAPVASVHIGTAYSGSDPTGQMLLVTGAAGAAAETITEMTQSTGAMLALRAAAGTPGVVGLASAKVMGLVTFDAFDASAFATMAKIRAQTTQQHTAAAHGTQLIASVTANNATTPTDVLYLAQNGYLGLAVPVPLALLDLAPGAGVGAIRMRGSTSGYLDIRPTAAVGNNSIVLAGDGTVGQVLTTDGAGNWSFATAPGASSVTGTGAASRLALWTGASALSSDSAILYDPTLHFLGIGVAPSSPVTIQQTASDGTFPAVALSVTDIISGSAAVAPFGLSSIVSFTASSWSSGNLTATRGEVDVTGAGVVTSLYGFTAPVSVGASAVVTNRYGYHAPEITGAGTVSGENVGFLCAALAKGVAHNWAFKSLGTTPSQLGGPLQLVAEAYSPASGMEGAIWHESSTNSIVAYPGATGYGLAEYLVGVVGTQYTSVTVANTASQTSLLTGSKIGTFTIPAGFLTVGKSIRITGCGTFRVLNSTYSATLRLKLGTTTVATATIPAGANWDACLVKLAAVCTATAAGNVQSQLDVDWHFGSVGTDYGCSGAGATSPGVGSLAVDLSIQWSGAGASNTFTLTNFIVEILD